MYVHTVCTFLILGKHVIIHRKTGTVKQATFIEETYVINTSKYNVSGVVIAFSDVTQWSRHVKQRTDMLVSDVTLGRTLMVHPATQGGAFPPGFLAFDQTFNTLDDDGAELVSCS